MAKQVDDDFFRKLIIECLDYLDERQTQKVLPQIKSLSTLINLIRSDYYSWFMVLISCIPPDCLLTKESLKWQVLCINLKDKNEEFLLSCSVLVQIVHFFVLKDRCFRYFDIASNCLSEIFNERYRVGFSDTDDWNEFEIYCETTLRRKRKLFADYRDRVVDDTASNINICQFWNETEIDELFEYFSYCNDATRDSIIGESARFLYAKHINERITHITQFPRTWEARILDSIQKISDASAEKRVGYNIYCGKADLEFCFGCVLTESYPGMKDESDGMNSKSNQCLETNCNHCEKEKEESLRIIKARLDETLPNKNSLLNMVDKDPPVKLDSNEFSLEVEIDSSKVINVTKSCTEIMEEESKVKHFELDKRLDTKDESSEVENSTLKTDNDDHQQVTNGSLTIPSEDMPISRIKVIRNMVMCGIAVMNKVVLISWHAISKVLKYKIYSLFKLCLYILRVFGRIIFRKSEIEENKPDLSPVQESMEGVEAESHELLGPRSVEILLCRMQCLFNSLFLDDVFEEILVNEDMEYLESDYCLTCFTQCSRSIYDCLSRWRDTSIGRHSKYY